jgi:P-type Cu2+ transporter
MSCCASPIVVDLAMTHQTGDRIALLEELQASVRKLADGSSSLLVSTPAIHCGNCISTIESQIRKLSGVGTVRANLSFKRVSLTFDGSRQSLEGIVCKLTELGFPPQSLLAEANSGADPELKSLIRALAVSGFAATNIMLLSVSIWNGAEGATKDLFHFVSALIAIPAVAYGGLPFFRSAVAALRHHRMNMDVPISLGVLLATGMSMYESFIGGGHAYFDAATSLLFFLLIGRTLDHMMRSKARAAADSLLRIAAKGGFVVSDAGELTYMALDALKPGMRIRIAAGERFPVDGKVVEGESDVDRALVTGESEALRITPGADVEAGTLNLTGPIDICASRAAKDSFLAEVTQMMSSAESGRTGYVRVADRMAKIYAPAVHVLAFASFVGWMLWTKGDWHQSLTVAIAVLIITCPCALGLAVPVAHVVSAGRLFKAGILMKDGSALERLAAITDAVFDKTGTLTTGEPAVRATTIPSGPTAALAKALAHRSSHPAARALARYLPELPLGDVLDVHEVAGHGVEARYHDKRVRLGRPNWVAEISSQEASGANTPGSAFALEGRPLYLSCFNETLRPDAGWMVSALRGQGISCRIISGDHEAPVAAVSSSLNMDGFQASMLPRDKLEYLKGQAATGCKVLMVGDGLNDAPALVAAHVSMAPSSASDVGRTAADFVFTRSSLSAVVYAYDMAVATHRIVKQNFGLAIIYNLLAVPLAVSGQLNPLLAAIAMSTSSIIVVGNSLRLHLLKPRVPEAPTVAKSNHQSTAVVERYT